MGLNLDDWNISNDSDTDVYRKNPVVGLYNTCRCYTEGVASLLAMTNLGSGEGSWGDRFTNYLWERHEKHDNPKAFASGWVSGLALEVFGPAFATGATTVYGAMESENDWLGASAGFLLGAASVSIGEVVTKVVPRIIDKELRLRREMDKKLDSYYKNI